MTVRLDSEANAQNSDSQDSQSGSQDSGNGFQNPGNGSQDSEETRVSYKVPFDIVDELFDYIEHSDFRLWQDMKNKKVGF